MKIIKSGKRKHEELDDLFFNATISKRTTKKEQLEIYLNELIDKWNPHIHDMECIKEWCKYSNKDGLVEHEVWFLKSPNFVPSPLVISVREICVDININVDVNRAVDSKTGAMGIFIKFYYDDDSWKDEPYISECPEDITPLFKAPLEKLPLWSILKERFERHFNEKQ